MANGISKIRKKTQLISKTLTTHQLTQLRENDVKLELGNFINREPERRGTQFFLGFYSKPGIKLALERYGVFAELKKRGFRNPKLEINTTDPFQQRLCIYSQGKKKKDLLVEVVLKRRHFTTYTDFPSKINGRSYEFLCVEWMSMQDPRATFTHKRPRLPGQKYPGLKTGRFAFELLTLTCKRLRLAGILNVPEYFHNAQMYSKTFHFLNPEFEGKRRAIERDLLKNNCLADVSWAIDLHCVKENDQPFKWLVSELIMPLDRDLQDYFSSTEYQNRLSSSATNYKYTIDQARWKNKKLEIPVAHSHKEDFQS
jgi:hypothetical protein